MNDRIRERLARYVGSTPGMNTIEDATPMRRWDDTPDRPDWGRDSVRMWGSIRALSRLLVQYRDQNEGQAARLNAAAKAQGHAFDRRADNAEGAAAAYSIAIATLVGALRVGSIDELTGERTPDWYPVGMQRPVLPDGIIPDDTDQRGDHFAGMPEPGDEG